MLALEYQLKEIANVKVDNLRLIEELKEIKLAHEKEKKWLDEQMKSAKLEQQKSEFLHDKDKLIFKAIRNDLEQGNDDLNTEIEHLTAALNKREDDIKAAKNLNSDEKSLVRELLLKLEDLHKDNQFGTELILKQNESLHRVNKQNLQLKRKNHKLTVNNNFLAQAVDDVESGIMKKIRRFEDDVVHKFRQLKKDVETKKIEVRIALLLDNLLEAKMFTICIFFFRLNRRQRTSKMQVGFLKFLLFSLRGEVIDQSEKLRVLCQ